MSYHDYEYHPEEQLEKTKYKMCEFQRQSLRRQIWMDQRKREEYRKTLRNFLMGKEKENIVKPYFYTIYIDEIVGFDDDYYIEEINLKDPQIIERIGILIDNSYRFTTRRIHRIIRVENNENGELIKVIINKSKDGVLNHYNSDFNKNFFGFGELVSKELERRRATKNE